MDQEAGKSFSLDQIKESVEKNKPAVLFLCQVRSRPCLVFLAWELKSSIFSRVRAVSNAH